MTPQLRYWDLISPAEVCALFSSLGWFSDSTRFLIGHSIWLSDWLEINQLKTRKSISIKDWRWKWTYFSIARNMSDCNKFIKRDSRRCPSKRSWIWNYFNRSRLWGATLFWIMFSCLQMGSRRTIQRYYELYWSARRVSFYINLRIVIIAQKLKFQSRIFRNWYMNGLRKSLLKDEKILGPRILGFNSFYTSFGKSTNSVRI